MKELICQSIEISKIKLSGDNPRIINKESQKFKDLVDSIKGKGVLIPVHVRPKRKTFELLAGERRFKASEEIGEKTIPALVHTDMSDEAAFELTFAENFARENLTPFEESKAVAILLKKYKDDSAAVASKMGKPVSWVTTRANINKGLSGKRKKEIMSGESDFSDWTAAHLALVARLPESLQEDVFDYYEGFWARDGLTVADLQKHIDDYLRLLSKAPWNIDDEKLIDKVGACKSCSKQTGHQPTLFEDLTEGKKQNEQCLDRSCWNQKMAAHIKIDAVVKRKEYPNLIYITTENSLSRSEKEMLEKEFGQVQQKYDYDSCKKSDKKAVPALVVYGDGVGSIKWVKLDTGVSTSTKRPKDKHGKSIPTLVKEKRKGLEKKRWFQVLRELIKLVKKADVDSIVHKDRTFTILTLAAAFGTHDDWRKNKPGWTSIKKKLQSKKLDYSAEVSNLWDKVKPVLCDEISYNGTLTQTPKSYIDDAKAIAELLGIDIKKIFEQVSKEKGFTEPKGWAAQEQQEKARSKAKSRKTERNPSMYAAEYAEKPKTKKTAKPKAKKVKAKTAKKVTKKKVKKVKKAKKKKVK